MNVLIIPNVPISFMKGGQEVQLFHTVLHLKRMGAHVRYLDFEDPQLLEWADVVHAFGLNNLHLAEGAAQRKPLVISPVFYQQSASKRLFLRLISRLPKTETAAMRHIFRLVKRILPNSEAEKQQLLKLFGGAAQQYKVVVNGVDPSSPGDAEAFRLKYVPDIAPSEKIILSAHRIEGRKNSLGLIEACGSLQLPLVLAGPLGKGYHNAYETQALKLIEKYPSVRYIGPLSKNDLNDAYAFAHVHALPSFMETPGLSSLEAGAVGCNLIVGQCPPVANYFDGIAWIVKQDVKSIQRGLVEALQSPRNHFSQADFIHEKYTWAKAAEQTWAAYEEALAAK